MGYNRSRGLHRSAVAAADKLATPGLPTGGTDVLTGGGLAPGTTYKFAVAAGNRWGTTVASAVASQATASDGNSTHCVKFTVPQITRAEWYDVFMSTDAAPKWVARVTEAQRAAAGCRITAVATVNNGGAGAAGTIQVNAVGTGVATGTAPFAVNNAYDVTAITPVDCAGKHKAYIMVKLAVTDFRSLPGPLIVVPFYQNDYSTNDWHQGSPQTLTFASAVNQPLEQMFIIDVHGSRGLAILVESLSGQGAAASVWVELG